MRGERERGGAAALTSPDFVRPSPAFGTLSPLAQGEGSIRQNSTFTDAALRLASPWYTASILLPSGSITNAP